MNIHNSNTVSRPAAAIPNRSHWTLLGLGFALLLAIVLTVGSFLYFSSSRFDPQPPKVAFREGSAAAGIRFVHNNGATSDQLLPESMGSGIAVFDFDGDGDQDLYFVNSTYWPWDIRGMVEGTSGALYRNFGDGSFEEVTEAYGLDEPIYGMGCATGDFDNDGWVDLYVSGVGEDRLYRNLQGRGFADVTTQSGVGGRSNEWSSSAAWVDFDRDGNLDLFVCNYVRWADELGIETAFKLAGLGHGYGGPQVNFTGTIPYLYLNNGDGTFREVGSSYGFALFDPQTGYPRLRALAAAPVDVDQDGWIDLVLATHQSGNLLFRNVDGRAFELLQAKPEQEGGSGAGIDVVRIVEGLSLGVALGSFANETAALYPRSNDGLLFGESEADPVTTALRRFGLFFFDYDLDGREDLLAVNGYLEAEINRIDPDADFRRSAQLFWNAGRRGDARFLEVEPESVGGELFRPVIGRGSAFADLDGDAFPDVVITQNGGEPLVFFNEGKSEQNWLRIKLVGTQCNRDAIGAEIEVKVGHRSVYGRVMPTRSYLSQSELPVTFGLGAAWKIREILVSWPDGLRERFRTEGVNQQITLIQGSGETLPQ